MAPVAVVLIVALLGLTAATLLVTRESRLKDQATTRARFHLDQAHDVVDRFGGIMNRRLASLPGTEGLRNELLREAERYYLDFLQYIDGAIEQDVTLRNELAKVQYRLAATYCELGELDEAEMKYQAAISNFEQLQDQAEWNAETQADMALCLNNLATLQKESDRYSEAMKNYRRAGELQEPLLAQAAASPRFLQEWALTSNNYGLLLSQSADYKQAKELFRETQSRLNSFLAHASGNIAIRQQLIECRNSLVAVLLDEDLDQAEELLVANITELQSMAESIAANGTELLNTDVLMGDPSIACQLAVSKNNLAAVLGRAGNREQGLRVIRDAIRALTEQSAESHTDGAIQEQLAIANNNLGQLLWRDSADSSAAEVAFRLAEKSLRIQVQETGRRPESLSRLAGVLHNLGLVHQSHGLRGAAIDCLTEAMELQAQAVKQVPFHKGYRLNLEKHRELLDEILSQFKDA